jgi:TetR/AcrR family transcriptional regulator, transcriptional repressor for nem operon
MDDIGLDTQLNLVRLLMQRKGEKKQRIIRSAKRLFHRQGYYQTTLADIAEDSGVSIGNIYYYFNTKKQIIEAIIEERTDKFIALAQQWEKYPDPKNRLLAFLEVPPTMERAIAKYGCAVGSLLQEISKTSEIEPDIATKTIKAQIDWVSEQFRLMGRNNARELAYNFIATIQGGCLLANSMKNHELLNLQLNYLKKTLDEGENLN